MSEPMPVQRHLMQDFVKGGGKDFDVKRYYHLVVANLPFIGVVITLSVAGAFAWVSRQPKEYGSRVVIQIEQEEQRILSKVEDLQPQHLNSDDYLNTIVQSMTNQTLMLRVAREVGLDRDPRLFPPRPDGKPYSDSAIAGAASKRVKAALRRGTRLMDISVEDEEPERAQRIADAVFHQFLRQNFEQQMTVANVATRFLQEQADQQKAKVESIEHELQTYREEHKAVSLDQNQNIVADKLRDLNGKVTAAKDARIRLDTDLEQLRRVRPDDTDGILHISSVAALPQVSQLRAQIVTVQAEFNALQKRYGRNHPRYIQAITTIQGLQDSLRRTLQDVGNILTTRFSEAKATETQLTAALHDQENEALNLSKIAIPYNVLQRNLASERALYDSLVTRIGETNISSGMDKSPFRLVEAPTVSWVPVKPEKVKTLLIALVFSLLVSVVIIVALDSMDDTLRSVDQAEEFLGMPALAVIPEEKRKSNIALPLTVVDEPRSRQAEAFRTIRASVSLLGPEETRKIFLFTSAVPSEGKTFTSLNTAAAFAVENLKTVVVEADLRMPTLHKAFKDIANRETPGLSDLLAGNVPLDEVLVQSRVPNLFLLFAGRKAPNPAELLSGKAFSELIKTLSERFDRVVIDSPPLTAVSDTLTIIRAAHYVCLVVRPAKTPKKAIARCAHLIHSAGGKLAGFFLNRVNFKVGASYYYYYYGDRYYADNGR
ncbi:MAG: polysaccharide biosynthesis tyrosine autokinase [Verrucomicrobia bacterium]|nr:polysaccharide biosynthesis tyrosine autokinase [Verrucomicrobiota bacterium]